MQISLKQNCLHISSLPSQKAEFLSNFTEASVALWQCPLTMIIN
uniref:Alternative protein RPL22 n=1 Tax=Homo sapiens TaxID=9606 RepID=L8E9H0_HUMAN|nr:alternative protein RPL22 [Homo sapiens]